MALLLCSCSAERASGGFLLDEPVFIGNTPGGDPQFRLEWTDVRSASWYEVYIFSQVDGNSQRGRLTPRENSCTLTLLDFERGYDTDTASYRIKVRPAYSGDGGWSNIWRIDFTDGEYTMTQEPPEPVQSGAVPSPAPTPAETPRPAEHSFPETLADFAAKEGAPSWDLSAAVRLEVAVNRCEYGEPMQTFTDPALLKRVTAALAGMEVEGLEDRVSSTGTYFAYSLYDANGDHICGFALQDGLLLGDGARYSLSGLEALLSIDEIMLDRDWDEYWAEYSAAADEYEERLYASGAAPTLFDRCGYAASRLAEDVGLVLPLRVLVRGDEHRGLEAISSDDPAVFRAMLGALSQVNVGEAEADAPGQRWKVIFVYSLPGESFAHSASISFTGDYLACGEGDLAVNGLDAFFACARSPVLDDLRDNRTVTVPVPKY